MHLVSYRGPGAAGGVSAALARAWESNLGTGGKWWHLQNDEVQVTGGRGAHPHIVTQIAEEVIKGHYRFCNDFLWPLLHDLPQYCTYVPEDYALYRTFNESIAWCLLRAQSNLKDYFVQDYQLALLPQLLRKAGMRSLLFWHIPWPKHVDEKWIEPFKEIARGMLNCEAIGFHTEEYTHNFMNFVEQYLPEFNCNREASTVSSAGNVAQVKAGVWSSTERQRGARATFTTTKRSVRLVAAPLGIDYDHWKALGANQQNALWHPALMRTPFILSVDRADYTKGVTDRIQSIDRFFSKYPEWVGRIAFAQICGKTRPGLQAFDTYWKDCQQLYCDLQAKWSTENWQPLLWLEKSFAPPDLAHAYRSASAMLISAVRDGLNLTAKEFVAAQGPQAGVLALSKGTGAWHELGAHTVGLEPGDIEQTADSIHQALTMDAHERAWRMALLKDSVRSNTLGQWWWSMTNLLYPDEAASNILGLRETS